jgi:AraC-like DNA-binding protein
LFTPKSKLIAWEAMMNAARMRYWRPVAEAGTDLGCGRLEVQQTVLHLHEEWQFAVAEVPAKLSLGAFRRYDAGAQHVTIVAPYAVHGEGSAIREPVRWHVLYVAPGLLKDLHSGVVPVFQGAIVTDPLAALELRDVLRQSLEGVLVGAEFLARTSGCLRHILAGSARGEAVPGRVPAVERARAYLQAHPTDSVDVEELEAVAGMTASHLIRSFSRIVGLPPKSYHAQLRLSRARRLLAEGRSATWVAYECGFADQSHLSRRFKESHGVTPGAFRAQWHQAGALQETPAA